jgi:hypothetical protein
MDHVLDIAQYPQGTMFEFPGDGSWPHWNATDLTGKFIASQDVDLHIETIGGGGGGGGSGPGDQRGGAGGGAGEYKLTVLQLKGNPSGAAYKIEVGKGGIGGSHYGAGGVPPGATGGGDSRVFHSISGFDYGTTADGGIAGQRGGSPTIKGQDGGGVVNPYNGKPVSTGGIGGERDRAGKGGEGPGAGSGGCGIHAGGGNGQSPGGNPGRVRVTIV